MMDLEGIYAKQNKSVRERQIMYFIYSYVEFKKQTKKKKRETKKQTLNYREQTDGYQRGGGWGHRCNR